MSSTSSTSSSSGDSGGCIEHPVSKMDTLAGVAIKYGVEVADIKRMNGLVTDIQMFALKSLQIPLPGRHPPSPCLTNGSASPGESIMGTTPPHLGCFSTPESCQPGRLRPPQQVSAAMNTLQSFYGLKPPNPRGSAEGTEMAIYRRGKSDYSSDEFPLKASPVPDSLPNGHHKSKFIANGFLSEIDRLTKDSPASETKDGESERYNEKSVRRRQKAEADSGSGTPEKLLKEENGGGSSSFSPITGKNLAMRPKSVSRTASVADAESGWLSSNSSGSVDPLMADGLARVHKSSSLSCLPDQEHCNPSSIRQNSKWSLKSDLQALSTSSLAKPLLDGLPISGRRNKAALD